MHNTDWVIKDCESILRNGHQFLVIYLAWKPVAESHSLSEIAQDTLRYAKPALPQVGMYNNKICDTESE
jgi:hypothetical protein